MSTLSYTRGREVKLSRLYSNQPEIFAPVEFLSGLNLVVAEIRIPANRDLDTHNLGKTTLGALIDFALLKGKSSTFFLFAHPEIFEKFTFYLEIVLDDGRFLTIARAVDPGSKVSFVTSPKSLEDAGTLSEEGWDHSNVSFERSKILLDAYLGLEALRPWSFRKMAGYLIRSQGDYSEVFQLGKFSGKHQDWKPFVAHLLGFSGGSVATLYEKREELARTSGLLRDLSREWGEDAADSSIIDALVAVKRRDIDERTQALDSLDLGRNDARISAELVEDLQSEIAALNEERYQLQQRFKRIRESLQHEQILFRPVDAERLFREAGVQLGNQIKRTYLQLIEFNRRITQERRVALTQQAAADESRLQEVEATLGDLNNRLTASLAYLRESEALVKFRELSGEVVTLKSELLHLERRREVADRLLELRREQRSLKEAVGRAVDTVEKEIETASRDDDSPFGRVRSYFNAIIHEVLGQDAILAVSLNDSGGIEFTAKFIGSSGLATSEDRGNSYRKLMCIAFDLAVLRAHLDVPFPRFVYHDGAFEQLDERKQEKLLAVLRKYAALGLQPIASALDSDLSFTGRESWSADVVLWLHDEGDEGRLFKGASW